MAKAKKSESTPKEAKEAKAGKPAAAKKGKAKASAPAAAPAIDTGAAAMSAAKILAAKAAGLGDATAMPTGGTKESAAFKNLKEGLAKPPANAMANLLNQNGAANLPKTHHQPFGANRQVGRNQTFGADVNRAGVPRRTGGG